MNNNLFVILPCYNEQDNISELIELWNNECGRLKKQGYNLIITPVDDASTDSTKQIILDLEKTYSNVFPLLHAKNMGLGNAVNTGFLNFIEKGKERDYAVVMDGDNTHKPLYIHNMLEVVHSGDKNIDCVIASRYRKNSKVIGVPLKRNFLSFGARIYYTLILGVRNVRDYTCGYRLYSYSILKKANSIYKDGFVKERGFSCMMEILYKLSKIGAIFEEVPFELRYDHKQGESKMKILDTIKESFVKAVLLRIRIR